MKKNLIVAIDTKWLRLRSNDFSGDILDEKLLQLSFDASAQS